MTTGRGIPATTSNSPPAPTMGFGLLSRLTESHPLLPSPLIPQSKSILVKSLLVYIFFPVVFPIVVIKLIRRFQERFGLRNRPLEGKVVLITGASSGIGEALAHQFYLSGCRLILASRRIHELDRVKKTLVTAKTYGVVYIPATLELDLEDLDAIHERSEAAVGIYGHIDVLINNAGISFRGNILKTSMEVHQRIMKVNYFGPLAVTRCVANQMVKNKNGGNIMFITSVQGKISIPHRSAYAASKHATQALADCLRAELSSNQIGVTVISPSYVQTHLSRHALTETGDENQKLDTTTANGYSTAYVAERTVTALINNEKEVTIAGIFPKIVILLRNIFPSLFFSLMSNRARAESVD